MAQVIEFPQSEETVLRHLSNANEHLIMELKALAQEYEKMSKRVAELKEELARESA